MGIGVLGLLLVAGASHAAETTGPEAPLAPAQDQPAAGAHVLTPPGVGGFE